MQNFLREQDFDFLIYINWNIYKIGNKENSLFAKIYKNNIFYISLLLFCILFICLPILHDYLTLIYELSKLYIVIY